MSGTRLDLRFIPEDMVFDSERTAIANETLDVKTYEPATYVINVCLYACEMIP